MAVHRGLNYDQLNHIPTGLRRFFLVCSTICLTMTTAKAFPPVDDAIAFFKNIDWADVKKRSRRGINNVGLVLAVLGEKLHEFGTYLGEL